MTPDEMQRIHLASIIFMILAFTVPIYLVFRFKGIGVVLGALFFWGDGIIVGQLLRVLDPARDNGPGDMVWLLMGWLPSIIYAFILFGIKHLILWIISKRKAQQQQMIVPPPYHPPVQPEE
jgi:hypothetical protein